MQNLSVWMGLSVTRNRIEFLGLIGFMKEHISLCNFCVEGFIKKQLPLCNREWDMRNEQKKGRQQ